MESRNHPLIVAAAAGVLIFSVLGVAVVNDVRQSAAARRDAAVPQPDAVGVQAPRRTTAFEAAEFEPAVRPVAVAAACADCGVIEAIRPISVDGGVSDRATYRVTLRMDDGSVRALSLPRPPAGAVGDAVRLLNGALARRG